MRWPRPLHPVEQHLKEPLQSEECSLSKSLPLLLVYWSQNLGKVLIDGELTTCLLDNRAQINFVTPTYAHKWGMDIMSLDHLAQEIGGQIPPIAGIGGIMVEPKGFIMINVQVPCVKGYNEDQIAIVMEDPELKDFQVILGTATIYRVMEVIKESEISELAIPWTSS